jgi:hypothetical protein
LIGHVDFPVIKPKISRTTTSDSSPGVFHPQICVPCTFLISRKVAKAQRVRVKTLRLRDFA